MLSKTMMLKTGIHMQLSSRNYVSSSPATLEAAKSVDAYGCMKGNETQQCDAQQAYVQSELGGVLKHGSVFPKCYDLNGGQGTMNPYVY